VSFIRPELQAKIIRWQEPLVHMGLILIELWVLVRAMARFNFTLQVLCVVLLTVSTGLLIVSIRKLRLRGIGSVQGHVEVDERRITYYTAGEGWSVSINDLRLVSLTSPMSPEGDLIWTFEDIFGTTLKVPSSARDVDGVFDALAALKGVNYEAITQASSSTGVQDFTIWTKP
jgi:hypothetical protein